MRITSASLSLIVTTAIALAAAAGPPPTRTEPVSDQFHGQQLIDNYRWLEALERDSEEVRDWTTAQNEYTRNVLDNLPGRAQLEQRLAELMTVGTISAPTMRGNRYFYTEREGDENQAILYVREGHDGEPRVLIDPNTLDERGLYSLDWHVPSQDGSLLAFGISYAGDEMTVLHVLDVTTGRWLADEIPGKAYLAGWMPDNSGFLYGVLDDPNDAYSRALRFHTLGQHPRLPHENPLLLKQREPSKIPGAALSRDGRWIIETEFNGWSKQNLWVIDAQKWFASGFEEIERTPIAVDLDARFSPQAIVDDTLYMFTTLGAPNGMIYAVDLRNPDPNFWLPIIREKENAVLREVDEARNMLIASYQRNATSVLEAYTLDGTPLGVIELPGLGSASISTHHDRTEAFISYTSFNEPRSIYRVNLTRRRHLDLWARPDVPVDPDLIDVKQEWTTSKDGTRVPMFIVHKKGLSLNGDQPTLLYGYGGFNVSQTPYFAATLFPWLEAGGVYAVANLRGGGEFGESWHRDGMLERKQNVFDDLYACAEYLIESGYTNPDRLAVMGGSNGGLLTGVAVTQRPDLFTAAISAVPLLDMLRFHHFLMARFWVPEYGDPDDPEQFRWLRAYSPYHNIKEGESYPAILFTAGENDNRVHPLHARKMAAAMQAMAANDPDEKPILLWVERESGHGSGKPLHLRIRDVADRWAFIMWQTGAN